VNVVGGYAIWTPYFGNIRLAAIFVGSIFKFWFGAILVQLFQLFQSFFLDYYYVFDTT
jgi:hypothetical protein